MPDINVDALQRKLEREGRNVKDIALDGPAPEREPTQKEVDQNEVKAIEMERENTRLRERLAEMEKERRKNEMLHKHWVEGNFNDLPMDHPFEILVHTDAGGLDPKPIIEPEINGVKYSIVRGIPTRVPHNVVRHLGALKYNFTVKEVSADGFPHLVTYNALRYPFSAHPVW